MQPSQLANPPQTFSSTIAHLSENAHLVDDRIIQKTRDPVQLQLCKTLEKGGVQIVIRVHSHPFSTLPNERSYGVGNHSAHLNNHDIACIATHKQCGPGFP